MDRIAETFKNLSDKNRKAFIAYIMAGDPNLPFSLEIMKELPKSGVDILEIGIPFTDPMADGPSIQLAGQRALSSGTTLIQIFDMISKFRKYDKITPVILMGYFNPIASMGAEMFINRCLETGVDGLIVVDLPPEEDAELCIPALEKGINFIRLATPTSNNKRLQNILNNTSGFLYYVSITGVTGAAEANRKSVAKEVERIKKNTTIPVCVGFGVKTPKTAKEIASVADGVVVGSAIVDKIGSGSSLSEIVNFCKDLAEATHSA
ncbi:MAG: tryptophan synthase subunit alpha [Pseudomonadota bacterium]|nr:tryptophan synthase subunit alpha [Pseudomonadota bacterium]